MSLLPDLRSMSPVERTRWIASLTTQVARLRAMDLVHAVETEHAV